MASDLMPSPAMAGFTWFVTATAALLVALIVGVVVAVLARFEFVGAKTARWTIAVLVALLAIDIAFVSRKHPQRGAIEITAVARHSWWELRYPGFVTANEMHVPVDGVVIVHCLSARRHIVLVRGADADRDALFGRETTLFLHPQRGELSDFNLDHFALKLPIIPDRDFANWAARQRAQAPQPSTRDATLGLEVFRTARCTYCHTVRGLDVAEQPIGPDLTHLGSRATIAARLLPNRRGHLAGWIVNSEALKRGSGMPMNAIDPRRLQWLLAFLQELR